MAYMRCYERKGERYNYIGKTWVIWRDLKTQFLYSKHGRKLDVLCFVINLIHSSSCKSTVWYNFLSPFLVKVDTIGWRPNWLPFLGMKKFQNAENAAMMVVYRVVCACLCAWNLVEFDEPGV
jgi:hypothetical protein